MAIKFKAKSKEEIPAELQALYVERDGELVLDVDGVVEKAKHDEFRAANIALKKELEDQKKRFEGIDPEEVRKLAEEKRQLEETQQLKLGEVEKVLENRLKTAKSAKKIPSCISPIPLLSPVSVYPSPFPCLHSFAIHPR